MASLLAHDSFAEGFTKSALMILVSEIGDKTFFIAAVMAMRHPHLPVLLGALAALWVMTALSAAMGWAAPALVSPTVTHHGATALFFVFGARSLYAATLGWQGGGQEAELHEVEAELSAAPGGGRTPAKGKKKGASANGKGNGAAAPAQPASAAAWLNPVLVKVFTLTFLAEWGDRSQVATIGLAASAHVGGVTAGGCLGHALCTGAAVLGGKGMAAVISERAVAVSGGMLFILFGLHSLLTGPPQ